MDLKLGLIIAWLQVFGKFCMFNDREESQETFSVSEEFHEFQQILSSSERKCIEHLGSVYYAITSEGDMN